MNNPQTHSTARSLYKCTLFRNCDLFPCRRFSSRASNRSCRHADQRLTTRSERGQGIWCLLTFSNREGPRETPTWNERVMCTIDSCGEFLKTLQRGANGRGGSWFVSHVPKRSLSRSEPSDECHEVRDRPRTCGAGKEGTRSCNGRL